MQAEFSHKYRKTFDLISYKNMVRNIQVLVPPDQSDQPPRRGHKSGTASRCKRRLHREQAFRQENGGQPQDCVAASRSKSSLHRQQVFKQENGGKLQNFPSFPTFPAQYWAPPDVPLVKGHSPSLRASLSFSRLPSLRGTGHSLSTTSSPGTLTSQETLTSASQETMTSQGWD